MSDLTEWLQGVKRNVVVLGLVSLFNDASSEMLFAILPTFMSSVLALPAGLIGLIEGAAEATASLLKPFAGRASDRVQKRKPFVLAGYLIDTVANGLFALARTGADVFFVRVFDRTGKGIRTAARDALIAESSDERHRGKVFGFHRAMDTLGAIVGPLLAYALLVWLPAGEGAYRALFLFAMVPGTIGVLLVALFVREARFRRNPPRPPPSLAGLAGVDARTRRFLLAAGVFALANYSYAFLLLRAQQLGVPIAQVPLFYLGSNVVFLLLATPLGGLADRVGHRRVLALGYALFALLGAGAALATEAWHALALLLLFGAFNAINDSVPRAFASSLAPRTGRATVLGTYHAVVGLVALPASGLVGALWQTLGAPAAFAWSAGLALLALVLLARVPEPVRR